MHQQPEMPAAPAGQPNIVAGLTYLALFGAAIAVGFGIYLGYGSLAMPQMERFPLWLLAITAGVASFFSPCAFPLLPAYLAIFAGARTGTDGATAQPTRAVGYGLISAAGVVTFSLILGAIMGALGVGIGNVLAMSSSTASWMRGLVGVALLLLGLAQWFSVNLKPGWVDRALWPTRPKRDSDRGPTATLYLYGLGYGAAGIACTGPILASLAIAALASGGFGAAFAAFGLFSVTMGALMVGLALLIAASQDSLIQRLKASTPRIKQVSAAILISVGLYTVVAVLSGPLLAGDTTASQSGMTGVDVGVYAPGVAGIYEGGEVIFIHTESSDAEVAALLTEMMGPEVVHLPGLAAIPAEHLANVYVFANGVPGAGPLGFQADVFDSTPAQPDYRPLRLVNIVRWIEGSEPRLLDSAAAIEAAVATGDVVVEEGKAVVNMPILVWPGGSR